MSDFDDDDPNAKAGVTEPAGPAGGSGGGDDDWDDDWDDDDDGGGGGGRRDMTLIVVIAVAVAVIALVVILTRPKDENNDAAPTTTAATGQTTEPGFCKNWPGKVGGDGKNVTKGEGVYIWSDFEGWHVRSNRTDQIVVKVTSPAPVKVKAKGNAISTADSGTDISLTIPAGDGQRGPDLDISCESTTVTYEVSAGGAPVAPQTITLGGSTKADANPITFARGEP